MATSVESSSPASLNKRSPSLMNSSSPLMFSPSSDKRFWSTLRSRVDTLLENRKPVDQSLSLQMDDEAVDRSRRLKEDSMLLLRGFDSVAQSLSQLSNNLENALQGARNLAKPPTLTEIVQAALEKAKTEESLSKEENMDKHEDQEEEEENEADKRGLKRKLDSKECTENQREENSDKVKGKGPNELEKMKKAKNLAISMATKAATMARELKSIRSDLGFMQERCALLEEENRKLRDGLAEGIQPDDDDLVRLQLEALLAEKSRLANENANLTRENQCLHQLVEYHQLTSQDLSASYENLIRGMGLNFSSPSETCDGALTTPKVDILGFSKSLDECFDEEEQE
ncbi:hypothetical protein CDL12_01407 [Handroanthus impetiginosus]|uniref:Uncharacterized protein n=1 Tax=Handroanthus impetiginosus TaxID=429701 RepID=A0A2G9I7W6_9LAMI|nr:hypothetical protein CDL12_01407 [Handroanthus impetiginosus]